MGALGHRITAGGKVLLTAVIDKTHLSGSEAPRFPLSSGAMAKKVVLGEGRVGGEGG